MKTLYTGKTKNVMLDEQTNVVSLFFKDSATGENGVFDMLFEFSHVNLEFKKNEIFVPEVLVAARAMNMGTQVLKPYLAAQGIKATGKVCIGTVQGDLHDIGKNLVKMMLESKGLNVVDLGVDINNTINWDLVIFLEPTVPFVQDGTRNEEIAADRKKFSEQLRAYYDRLHIPYKVVNGENYAVRLTQAKDFINHAFFRG